MRERVLDAIYKKLEEDPENENLQRQITLLNMASICTIDSFCLEVVKNNFFELNNVSPNFRIADTPEIELLKQEILDDIFEKKYEEDDSDFTKLVNTYTSYKDDTPLKDLILKIHGYIGSSPFPKEWLHEKIEMFNLDGKLNEDFSKTPWGSVLLEELDEELIDDIAVLEDARESLTNDKDLEVFEQIIASDIKQLKTLQDNLQNWDDAYEIAQNIKFQPWSRKKVESEIKAEAKEIRDTVKEKFNKKIGKILTTDSKQSNQDIFDMYDILKKLEKLILEFDEVFSKRKREKNIVDFTDIEHFALEILVKKDENGNVIKTDVAKKYTEKFEEIAIDEYQDSNLVQEYILTSVSRGNNIFMVGDVKQSIYRFRQAMPRLFLDKYNNYEKIELNETERNVPINGRKIQLFKNFRSRDNILDFTNLVFKNIMSETLGEVEYDRNEYLNFGAEDYQKVNQNLKTEIDIIEVKKDDQDLYENNENDTEEDDYGSNNKNSEDIEDLKHLDEIEVEAKYVAKKIKELIDSKYQVYDRKSKSFRDIKYKDIAILLRSTKNKANIFEQEIINNGMPVFSDSTQEYLESIEIQTIMSLLKIIDNPIQDIPLVTVLRSSIGGFTDNELVEIRLSDKYDNFYECMKKAKINVGEKLKEKIEKFLNNLENWRKEQEYLALDELIWKIYSDTGYYNYVGLMPNGILRQANLRILFERAKKYETASFKGLYNFINFMDKLKINSGDLSSAKIIGENDDVIRIMSIHKSKGLEFPVVFLVNSNKQFNEQDIKKEPVLLHQELGIGAKYIDYNAQIKYDTLTRQAVKNIIKTESISEEMRILYVALTRAKEKLFITGTSKNLSKKLEGLEKQTEIYHKTKEKINPVLVKKYKSYLDWILLVYQYEKNSTQDLLELNIIDRDIFSKLNKTDIQEINSQKIKELMENKDIEISKEQMEDIKNKIEYEYQNKLATTIPTKSSVTKIKQMQQKTLGVNIESLDENPTDVQENKEKKIDFGKPKFLQNDEEQKITPAQRGTLVHLCMQKLNFKEEYNLEKISELIQKLKNKEIITEKEAKAINMSKILNFIKSDIAKELKEAKEIYKEKPFYINVPAREIYKENCEENILVQGIIDLYYIDKDDNLKLLDYKTDYVEPGNEQELVKKYSKQLELYKEALEEALNKKVEKVYIYSVYLEKTIEI